MKRETAPVFVAAIQAALVCAAVVIAPSAHAKGHCPGSQQWQCTTYATSQENGAWYDAKTGRWYNKSCSCRDDKGSGGGSGSYGHAEIHKTHVPTVKPSGAGPTNLARPPLGLRVTPRAPTPAFQSGRTF